MSDRKFERADNLSWQGFEDGLIVLNPVDQQVHELNASAAFIWQKINELGDIDRTAKALAEEFAVEVQQAEADVEVFVRNALQGGLLTERMDS